MINRPVIISNGIHPICHLNVVSGFVCSGSDVPDEVLVDAANFGRSMAINVIVAGDLEVVTKGDKPPKHKDCLDHSRPPANYPHTAVISRDGISDPNNLSGVYITGWFLTDLGFMARVNKGDDLFAVGCAYYDGLDKNLYYSDICAKWNPASGQFETCLDADRNKTE